MQMHVFSLQGGASRCDLEYVRCAMNNGDARNISMRLLPTSHVYDSYVYRPLVKDPYRMCIACSYAYASVSSVAPCLSFVGRSYLTCGATWLKSLVYASNSFVGCSASVSSVAAWFRSRVQQAHWLVGSGACGLQRVNVRRLLILLAHAVELCELTGLRYGAQHDAVRASLSALATALGELELHDLTDGLPADGAFLEAHLHAPCGAAEAQAAVPALEQHRIPWSREANKAHVPILRPSRSI